MAQVIQSSGHMYFSGTGPEVVEFGRSAMQLYLTVSGGVGVSLDGGTNFLTLADGTHVLPYPNIRKIYFRNGAWSGYAIAV